MVNVPGLLPQGSKLIDTPGVPHPYQIASQLSADEVRSGAVRRVGGDRTGRGAALPCVRSLRAQYLRRLSSNRSTPQLPHTHTI